jgi:hypothetical protein
MKGGFEHNKSEINFIEKIHPKMCSPYKYIPAIIDKKHRVVVFGDIHGDYNLTLDMLTKAQLITITVDSKNNDIIKWVGGKTYVVQVGDQIDRCRPTPGMPCTNPKTTYNDEASDIKIMLLFNDLGVQAEKVGGCVISLLGNHEILNVLGHMDYVSHKGLNDDPYFKNYVDPNYPSKHFSSGKDARIHAFAAGNELARMMGCTRLPAVIIGSNIFVHAGIVDGLIEEIKLKGLEDFERINIKIRQWLLGLLDQNYVEHIIKYSKNSMFWTRILGSIPPGVSLDDPRCSKNITNVLSLFKIGSMVIGHTPQSFIYSDDINSTCDGKIWRVDNGSSAAFNVFDDDFKKTGVNIQSRRTQYLEIIDDSNYFVCDGTSCKKQLNAR